MSISMFNFSVLLLKTLVLVYFVIFFLFFLVSIGFHVQVQSRHKRFVYRKRYSSTIRWTFSHFSFFIYCFYTFPLGCSFLCLNAFCVGDIFCKGNCLQNCPTCMASQKVIFALASKNESEIQTNPCPGPLNLSFCPLKGLLVQLNFIQLNIYVRYNLLHLVLEQIAYRMSYMGGFTNNLKDPQMRQLKTVSY